jgi:hypothetical protein
MSRGLRFSEAQLAAATQRLGLAIAKAPTPVGSVEAAKNEKARKQLDAVKVAKPRKYRNEPVTDAAGIKHASKRQAKRYTELGYRMKSGELLMLGREVRFRLPGGVEYRADHVYANQKAMEVIAGLVESGDLVIEDVKSPATAKDPLYRVKKTQMRECLGISITEIL